MITNRNQDFHRIKTDEHRLWYSALIPSRFWDNNAGEPSFNEIGWRKSRISVDMQRNWYNKLISGKSHYKPHLAVFASEPSDEIALSFAFEVCKKIIKTKPANAAVPYRRIQIQKVSFNDITKLSKNNESCEMFVLQNVLSSADKPRITLIRDWIKLHEDSFRIVVIAGNPFEFHATHGVDPDIVLSFQSSMKFVKSF